MPRLPVNWLVNLPLVLPPKSAVSQVPYRHKSLPLYMQYLRAGPADMGPYELPIERMVSQVLGLGDYVDGVEGLGIDVSIKIPKAVTEAARLAPSIAHQFPLYAREFQKETAKVTGTVDAINIGLQTLGVSLIVGGIVAVLLLREKPKA